MSRFEKTYCSQCGGEFGPGEHGYSHCEDHLIGGWQAEEMLAALRRVDRAIDFYLGRSSFTQTRELKGLGYSEAVRKELYAAHDVVRLAITNATVKVPQ